MSYHEFELALGDLSPLVLGDGLDPEPMSYYGVAHSVSVGRLRDFVSAASVAVLLTLVTGAGAAALAPMDPIALSMIWQSFPFSALVVTFLLWCRLVDPESIRIWPHRPAVDPSKCPVCNYDGAGLPAGAVCPECGAAPPPPDAP